MMNRWAGMTKLLRAALLLVCVCAATSTMALDRDPFELRLMDEVEMKDGRTEKGDIRPHDNPDEIRLTSRRNNVTQTIRMADVKEIRRKQSPADALDRIGKEYAGKPTEIARICREAVNRFSSTLVPKVLVLLEKESGTNDPEVLALMCELQLQTSQAGPALSTAEKLVKAMPRPRSLMWRGQANRALENIEAAEKDFEKAYKEGGEDEQIVIAYANFLYSIGRGAEAEACFKTVLNRSQGNLSGWVGLGLVQLRQSNFAEAEKSFTRGSDINKKSIEPKLGLAAVKLMQGNYDEAYRLTVDILNIDTKSAEAFQLQALSKLFKGDKDSLRLFDVCMRDAMEAKPAQPRFMLAWAAGLERYAKFNETLNTGESLAAAKGQRDQAAAKYAELLKLNPDDAYIQYFIGTRKFAENDFTGAEAAFQRASKLALKYPHAHASLGAVQLKLGKWDAAKTSYENAIALDPEAAEFLAGKGLALLKTQQFAQASEAFKQAIAKDGQNVTALCGLAYVFNFEKNRESCVSYLQQALAADGGCAYAADALKKIYGQEGRTLEYVTFDNNPVGWRPRAAGVIKPVVTNKRLEYNGKQGAATGAKLEYCKDVRPEQFQRIEADFIISPTSPVTFGLRLAPTSGAAFELEFGKDESNQVKWRVRDTQTTIPAWREVGVPWPAQGPIRLAIESDDLKTGVVRFAVNGKRSKPATLAMPQFKMLSAGVFVQVPAQEVCNAIVDNVVLVTKGGAAALDSNQDNITIDQDKKEPVKNPDEGKK